MTRCKVCVFISTLLLSLFTLQAGAVDIFPTCEIDADKQTIDITDGYENYIAELPGGDLEYIASSIDPNHNGQLYSRIYETEQMLQPIFDSEAQVINEQAVLDDWQDRNKLYGSPKLVNGVSSPVLMEATILDKDELRYLTELNAAGQELPQRTEVFSEPVHFEAETVGDSGEWRNTYIPLSVYKFWGLFVPKETGSFKIRFQKDDGLIVHMDLGQGQGLETIIDKFLPINDHNDTGLRIIDASHGNGNTIFEFTANEAYPLHIQWLNYDGPHAMQMEYSPSNSNDWKIVPQDWFNAGRDPRGITKIEFEKDLSPSSLLPDISDLLDGFSIGDSKAAGVYAFEEGVTQAGLHNIIVTNEAGYQTNCSIKIPSLELPVVALAGVKKSSASQYSNSVTILLGENVSFKASDSISYDSDLTIDDFDWDLGDGSAHKDIADFEYSYTQAGTYHATLTVSDEYGTDSATVSVLVQDPPVAKAVFANEDVELKTLSIILGETLEFDASLSKDSDGDIVSYSWDFGDTGTGSGETLSYEYQAQGSYNVTLTVIDEDGLSSTDTLHVEVKQLIEPRALVSLARGQSELELISKVDPDTGEELQGFLLNQFDEVLLSGEDSFDYDGVIVDYLWQGLEEQHAKEINFSATSLGDKQLSLTVFDDDGLSHTYKFMLWVNAAPYADIQYIDISYDEISDEARANFQVDSDKIIVAKGSALVLDASGSYDDGEITQYIWCPGDYFDQEMKVCDVENAEEQIAYGPEYEYQDKSNTDEFITLILEDELGAKSAVTFKIVKYEAHYSASGSFNFVTFVFIALVFVSRLRRV